MDKQKISKQTGNFSTIYYRTYHKLSNGDIIYKIDLIKKKW